MCMFLAYVLDAKVIYDESEHDESSFVALQARHGIKLVVAFIIEVLFKEFVGKDARL